MATFATTKLFFVVFIPDLHPLRLLFFGLFCCTGLGISLGATGDASRFLRPVDSVFLTEQSNGQLFFQHGLVAGQTLYSLAKFYGLTLEEVYFLNPRLRAAYKPGDEVRVSVPPIAIRVFVPYDSIDFFAPVYLEVRPGQTIYGLVNRTLKISDERPLLANNPKLDISNLRPGQQLFLGWLSLKGINSETQLPVADPMLLRNSSLKKQWEEQSKGKKLVSETGKAAWTKDGDPNAFLALHRTAPIGSCVEVMDKRTGRTYYCRVVGRVPAQVYDNNVQLVVSPLLVKAFNVRDKFFYVQVKHY
ncbi:MAG: hypothetical protein HC821_03460 [Lewinella sp.]|nr:hypothetical protein [Lewinella sp.]